MVKTGKSVSMDAELWMKVEEMAKEKGCTISDALENIVKEYFELKSRSKEEKK